jgi:hypothetical protein
VSVKATAFSRTKGTTGTWETAYVGAYGGGLGVTDRGEGSGSGDTHTVDNVGRDNYVVFRFSQDVILDKARLGYVVGDSDLKVWIGSVSNAFNSTVTLSDSFLSGLGFTELNDTTLTGARTAELNAGNYAGNVVVIAASTQDTTPDDFFKIQNLQLMLPSAGVYANRATVTVPGAAPASDMSHYRNAGTIRGQAWHDTDRDGVQETGEAAGAQVTVTLRNTSGATVATTTTNAAGEYSFNVMPGTYSVAFARPAGTLFTGFRQTPSQTVDSDVQPATGATPQVTVTHGQVVTDLDAGFVSAPKFYVVDAHADKSFQYLSQGGHTGSFGLKTGGTANTAPRDVAANPDGSRVWVLDHNKNVFVYDSYGNSLGQWSTSTALGAAPEGLAMANGHIWLADQSRNVLFFQNGADRTSGSGIAPTKTFVLPSHVTTIKGMVSDGTTLWVVAEGTNDVVYRFTIAGTGTGTTLTANGSFTLPSAINKPTGITIDMATAGSTAMWVVDSEDDAVYLIANGRTLGSGHATATKVFDLASGNGTPEGIADPLSFDLSESAVSLDAAVLEGVRGEPLMFGPLPAMADLLDAGNLDGLLGRDVAPAGTMAANDEQLVAADHAEAMRRLTGLMRDDASAMAMA